MDDEEIQEPTEWSRKCVCGKRFHQVNAYSNHINGCKKYKNGVGASLELAKACYAARKSKKGKERQTLGSYLDDGLDVDHVVTRATSSPSTSCGVPQQQVDEPPPTPAVREVSQQSQILLT
jgi:hypothetical protein